MSYNSVTYLSIGNLYLILSVCVVVFLFVENPLNQAVEVFLKPRYSFFNDLNEKFENGAPDYQMEDNDELLEKDYLDRNSSYNASKATTSGSTTIN